MPEIQHLPSQEMRMLEDVDWMSEFKHYQNRYRNFDFEMDRYRRPLGVWSSDWYRSKGTLLYFQLVTTVLFFVNNFVFIFRKNCWNLVSKTNFCQFVFTNIWGRKSGNDKYLNIHSMPIQDFRYALRVGFDAKVYQFLCRSEVVMRFSIMKPWNVSAYPDQTMRKSSVRTWYLVSLGTEATSEHKLG